MKKIIYSPGEPSGIGPDLIIKLSSSKLWEDLKIPIVSIGDQKLFVDRAALLKKKIKIVEIESLNELSKNTIGVIQIIKVTKCSNTRPGKLYKSNAQYVLDNLTYSIKQTMQNEETALVTGPLSLSLIHI